MKLHQATISESRYDQAHEFESDYWNSRQHDPVGVLHDFESPFDLSQHLQQKGYLAKRYRRFLDVGCGGLGLGILWLIQAEEAIGLDPLPVLPPKTGVALLDDFISGVQSRTKYVTAKAESMPFEDGYFDLIVCNNVLDHVHDPFLILNEIMRTLAPDGLFAFAVDTHSLRTYIVKKIMKRLAPNFGSLPGHPYEWTESQMSAILRVFGFSVESHKPRSMKGRILGRVRRTTWLLRHSSR
jgi:SAM-dependent methyltransferase